MASKPLMLVLLSVACTAQVDDASLEQTDSGSLDTTGFDTAEALEPSENFNMASWDPDDIEVVVGIYSDDRIATDAAYFQAAESFSYELSDEMKYAVAERLHDLVPTRPTSAYRMAAAATKTESVELSYTVSSVTALAMGAELAGSISTTTSCPGTTPDTDGSLNYRTISNAYSASGSLRLYETSLTLYALMLLSYGTSLQAYYIDDSNNVKVCVGFPISSWATAYATALGLWPNLWLDGS